MARAIVFVHYDRDGIFDDHVIHALRAYRRLADRLVVVSASARALSRSLEPIVDTFIPRENVGYDFCSWRAGLESLGDVAQFDEVVCANDSVYGPLFDLGPAFSDPRIAEADFWGMCLSDQGTKRRGGGPAPHLQSWFFAMRRPLLESSAFRTFWNSVVPLDSKKDIVTRYEVGMSQQFLAAGFRIAGLYDARAAEPLSWRDMIPHLSLAEPGRSWRHIKKASRSQRNPSELAWDRLIAAGVPFVKVGLFRVNHYGLNLRHVLRGLEASTPYDVGLIRRHLARVGSQPLD
jgi:lipopolysaccharide biosynthesis protein